MTMGIGGPTPGPATSAGSLSAPVGNFNPAPAAPVAAAPETTVQPVESTTGQMVTAAAKFDLPAPSEAMAKVASIDGSAIGALLGMLFGRASGMIPALNQNPTLRDAALGAAVMNATGLTQQQADPSQVAAGGAVIGTMETPLPLANAAPVPGAYV